MSSHLVPGLGENLTVVFLSLIRKNWFGAEMVNEKLCFHLSDKYINFITWLALCSKLDTLDRLQCRPGVGLIFSSSGLNGKSLEALITVCDSV